MRTIFLIVLLSALAAGVMPQKGLIPIAEIQGTESLSPRVGQNVVTAGIVTAIRRQGFYIQTPDADVDTNPKTSEGLYVYTKKAPPSKLRVGDKVEVKGGVIEFRSERETYSLFLTEIVDPSVKILSKGNGLPKAITITSKILSPKGPPEQLEPYEGMRVKVDELTVVGPTGGREEKDEIVSDGIFFGVISGTARPFREPGLDVLSILFQRLPRTIPAFDMNPEIIRVDSIGLKGGTAIDVTAEAKIKNVVGVLDYSHKAYTILLDRSETPAVTDLKKIVQVSAAMQNEITIGSFNLENFFDDEKNSKTIKDETRVSKKHFKERLQKTALAIREALSYPDVLGVIEVENLIVLEKLAAYISVDAKASGKADPKYKAYLVEGNDIRGIDVGFLVKSEKINILHSEQLAAQIKLQHKDADPDEMLFSRPPFLIEVEAKKADGTAFAVTVIVNHFKSYRGIDDPVSGDRVRNKKLMQAEFVAKTVHERQVAKPSERILLIGDFNAFQFNDGFNDLIGILKGNQERNVLVPSKETFETGLIDLVEHISDDSRYSYVYEGSAQVLDHVLANGMAYKFAKKFGYARFNADFPKIYSNDPTRPERVSDHDVPVVFLDIESK